MGSIQELSGFVENVRKKSISIRSRESGECFFISWPHGLARDVRKGDHIISKCILRTSGEMEIEGEPFIIIPSNRDSMISMFHCAIKSRKNTLDKLYTFFEMKAKEEIDSGHANIFEGILGNMESPVFRNRNENGKVTSLAVFEMINFYAERMDYCKTINCLSSVLELKVAKELLQWWYINCSRRRLKLLSLSDEEIENCISSGWRCSILYYQLLNNPFLLDGISMATASRIAQSEEKYFPKEIVKCGSIIRILAKVMKEQSSTSIPISRLKADLGGNNEELVRILKVLTGNFYYEVKYECLYPMRSVIIEDTIARGVKELNSRIKKRQNEHGIFMVNGCCGTGKSTTAVDRAREALSLGEKAILCSTTNMGAFALKRMVGDEIPVFTLHSLLMDWNECDLLIVDDASLSPSHLLAELFFRLSKTRLILVGDEKGPRPIGEGEPFFQLLKSGVVPYISLNTVYRFKCTSLYLNMIKVLIEGECTWQEGFSFIEGGLESAVSLGVEHIKSKGNFCILCPFKEEMEMVNQKVNQRMAEEFPDEITVKGFRVGDKILVKKGKFAGYVGEVIELDEIREVVTCSFGTFNLEFSTEGDGREFHLKHAWSLSLYGVQGVQYDHVVLYFPRFSSICTRELLYLGIGRAVSTVTIITHGEILQSILKSPTPMRCDNLARRLVEK